MKNKRLALSLLFLVFHCLNSAVPKSRLSLTGLVDPKVVPGLPGQGPNIPNKPDITGIAVPRKADVVLSIKSAKSVKQAADNFDRQQALSGNDTANNVTEMFGPHLFTSDKAIAIGAAGDVFLQAAKTTLSKISIPPSSARKLLERIDIPIAQGFRCPFSKIPKCNRNYPYRQIDGSCNNLANPLWGRANTPFERFLPAFYDDGFQSPRETSYVTGGKLPSTRHISVRVHEGSNSGHQANDINHFTVLFGQFVSHDIELQALAKGYLGSNLDCCKTPNRRNCFPIAIAKNDPHFGRFGRTCMNLVRALPTPSLDCKFGQRQQLNQITCYIDGSNIYGSSLEQSNKLRLKLRGELKTTNRDLLPQDVNNEAACILKNPNHKCFLAGDVRVNQQPMLMSVHTIWMKEHNRVAERLAIENPHWNDEKLFQESRKIVIAELQHITYNEFLPEILGRDYTSAFDLNPAQFGYFTGYNERIMAQIRAVFAVAAYRMGHSMIRDKVAYRKVPGTTMQEYLFRTFLRPDLLYSPLAGIDGVTRGLYESFSQSVDRFVTKQLTNHLFERTRGFGGDLAAINMQRGGDYGVANYNTWRVACGLKPAQTFKELIDHTADAANALSKAYGHPDDIDAYSGGVSEIPVSGGKVGPLFACLLSLQFKALKFGDRFYYETNNANIKFTLQQLAEIRKTTMARVICDNTITDKLPVNVFRKASASNRNKDCNSFVKFDFQIWKECVDGGWSSWKPASQALPCLERRICDNPRPNPGCKPCVGPSTRNRCGTITIGPPILRPPKLSLLG